MHDMVFYILQRGLLTLKMKNGKNDFSSLDENGDSFTDQLYSKAYLRHLFVAGEQLGAMIASLHNLRFYNKLMEDIREHIMKDDFYSWKNEMIKKISVRL